MVSEAQEYSLMQEQINSQFHNQALYPSGSQQRMDRSDLLDKIKPELIVETIKQKLMGKDFINGKWIKNPNITTRGLSESGAHDISTLMLPASSQNVAVTNIDDNIIRRRTLSIVKTTQRILLKNWREYGVTGTDQLHSTHEIVMTNTLVTMKQPQDGGLRNFIGKTTSEVRSVSNQEKEKNFVSRWLSK